MNEKLRKISKNLIIGLIAVLVFNYIINSSRSINVHFYSDYYNYETYFKVANILNVSTLIVSKSYIFYFALIYYLGIYIADKKTYINLLPLKISLIVTVAFKLIYLIVIIVSFDSLFSNASTLSFLLIAFADIGLLVGLVYTWYKVYYIEDKNIKSNLMLGMSSLIIPILILLIGAIGSIFIMLLIFLDFELNLINDFGIIFIPMITGLQGLISTISYTAALVFFITMKEKNITYTPEKIDENLPVNN